MNEEQDLETSVVTPYRLQGRVVDASTGIGLTGYHVELRDSEGICEDLVAATITDELGDFTVALDSDYLEALFLDRQPALSFRVLVALDGQPGYRVFSPSVTWQPSHEPKRIRIGLDPNSTSITTVDAPAAFVIRGRVTTSDGSSLNGCTVRAFDKGLGTNRTQIGDTVLTDWHGRYRITYAASALGRPGKLQADLVVSVTRVDGENEDPVVESREICHAPATAIVDLVKRNAPYRGRSELERVRSAVLSVIGTASISGLGDEDISYIACTTREDRHLIELLVKAEQLGSDIGIEGDVIYVLLREGLPPTRRGILSQRPSVLRAAIERAVADNIAGMPDDPLEDVISGVLALLVEKMASFAVEVSPNNGTPFGRVLETVISSLDDRKAFAKAAINHEGTVDAFWTALAQQTPFQSQATIDRLKLTMQWGALTRYHAPLVKELARQKDAGMVTSLRGLAKYDENDWKAILDSTIGTETIGFPSDIPGANDDEKKTNYARVLARTVETAFPTAVIGHRVTRDEGTQADISRFFANNPDFEFGTKRVSSYLQQSTGAMVGVTDVAATTQRLKGMERVFRMTRRYSEMKPLLDAGHHSARSIQRMGKKAFVKKFASQLGGADKAESIYGKAEWIASAATALFGKYSADMNGTTMFALPDMAKSGDQPHQDLADWASLFGTLDGCACEHCRSVYGPAAYLVDLLEFLDRYPSTRQTPDSTPENPIYYSARDVLIGSLGDPSSTIDPRRPDIAHILLSCENTDTTLPYIDLVNEILEIKVAALSPAATPASIESKGTSQELLAAPEPISKRDRIAAYVKLASEAVHPFDLPFDLWAEEARVYLEHLGVPRHELLETFAPNMAASQLAQERLRLSTYEWGLITNSLSPSPETKTCWGMTSNTWLGELAAVPRFLKQSGLSFEELRELLATRYVNPNPDPDQAVVRLSPEIGCDIDAKTLKGPSGAPLDEATFGRIHRFLRLRKRLGFTITELDQAMSALGSTVIDGDLLGALADIVVLREELDLPLPVLLSFWASIGTRSTEWSKSLYEELFLNKSVMNPLDDAFKSVADGQTAGSIVDHAAGILAALRIGAVDLALLVVPGLAEQALGLSHAPLADSDLNLSNLSRLHRIVALARALGLGVGELLVLRELSGLNALTGDDQDLTATPATTRQFVALARNVRDSGFSVAEADALVRPGGYLTTTVDLPEATAALLVGDIETAVAKIVEETQLVPDLERTQLRSLLLKFVGDEGDTPTDVNTKVNRVMAVLEAPSTATDAAINEERSFIGSTLGFLAGEWEALDLDQILGRVTIVGGMSTRYAPLISSKEARFDYVFLRLLNHERRTQVESIVKQKLSAEAKLEAAVIDHLLTHTLKASLPGNKAAIADFYPEMNDPSGASQTVADASDRKTTVRRVHKAALILQRLKLDASELPTIDPPANAEPTWFDLSQIDKAGDLVAYRARFVALLRLVDLVTVRDALPEGRGALLGILHAAQTAGSSVASVCSEISARTGWANADVYYLAHEFNYLVSDLGEEKALLHLQRCFRVLQRLGASPQQAVAWIDLDASLPPVPASNDEPDNDLVSAAAIARDIKRVARAKYDDAQWAEVARPLCDVLREKQRDALVGYLVSKYDLKGPDQIFELLLVDVEMSPCQLTSRIKQAIGSVQLFVQRALLGPEKDVKLDEDASQEWTWMKSYRVWEANRKVFLYPENWIEPELRDDKTPFFKELENSLLQGDITAEAAESAYVAYLDKLHEVGRLEVAAMCHQREDGDGRPIDVVHVVARTPVTPHRYYYRKRVDSSYWTPWEKLDLDIQGNHLLATVWNRRLYLIWPVFEERADSKQEKEGTPKKHWQVSLRWSEYQNDVWGSVKTTADKVITIRPAIDPALISFTAFQAETFLRINCAVNWYGVTQYSGYIDGVYVKAGWFRIDPCAGELAAGTYANPPFVKGSTPTASHYTYGWMPTYATSVNMALLELPVADKPLAIEALTFKMTPLGNDAGDPTPVQLFEQTPGQFRIVVDRLADKVNSNKALQDALFFADDQRTFFMDLRWQAHIAWKDLANAYPNAPAPVGVSDGLDQVVLEWANEPKLDIDGQYSIQRFYRFHSFYHPYVCEFTRRLARDGLDGLLQWSKQGATSVQLASQSIATYYGPTQNVGAPFPVEDVDFSFGGAYSQYNWELFFHAPFLIATRLTKNGNYAEAQRWFHYIFDPTGGSSDESPQRFWNVKPLRDNKNLATIQEQLEQLAQDNPHAQLLAELVGAIPASASTQDFATQIARWRDDPFNPHLIARMRPLAYQKAVVIKYIENLIAWGDSLFLRDTIESINEATQLYILASDILGPRPRVVKEQKAQRKTYAELEPLLDAFSNALVEIENIGLEPQGSGIPSTAPQPVLHTLYFCVPQNENLLALWDTVADRLFKIRNCMNIEGTVRQLPLFEPPIDPALLVKAAAAGVDIGSVLSPANAPLPLYRFSVLHSKAMEFAGSVVGMGGALLAALEKRDGEALSLLRQKHELNVLTSVRAIRQRQVDEANESLESLRLSRKVAEEGWTFYRDIERINTEERAQEIFSFLANVANVQAGESHLLASVLRLMPQINIGGPVPPKVESEFGGVQLGGVAEAAGALFSLLAQHNTLAASMAGTMGNYRRRWEEWKLKERTAQRELDQIDRQIAAAEIRLEIAKKELANHDLQIKQAKEVEDYLRDKYTSTELYDWMVSQVAAVYFQAYKLAFDLAKRAEKAFQFELAQPDASYIKFGYWDSLKKGLLAGEKLQHDLRRMEAAYLDQNKREYEITKHVSLAEIDPTALLTLRGTGTCEVTLPEWLFDRDWPGHYLRRIKSVSLTVPVVNGPYAGVNCKLTLLSSRVRKTNQLSANDPEGDYPHRNNDGRFLEHYGAIQSIVTSSGQGDAGLFELAFRDDRYLPFEGAGAESAWRIELEPGTNQFDPTAVHDVVMHVRYTAREGGQPLKTAAGNVVAADPVGSMGHRLFSAKTDFPDAWEVFTAGSGNPIVHRLSLPLARRLFQPLFGSRNLQITRMQVFAKRSEGSAPGPMQVQVWAPEAPVSGNATDSKPLQATTYGQQMLNAEVSIAPTSLPSEADASFSPWTLQLDAASTDLEDIWVVCEYRKQ